MTKRMSREVNSDTTSMLILLPNNPTITIKHIQAIIPYLTIITCLNIPASLVMYLNGVAGSCENSHADGLE